MCPNQGFKTIPTYSFPIMWLCFHNQNFKQPTNYYIFGIDTAFSKLVTQTNRHIRNDVLVPAKNITILLIYSNGLRNMKYQKYMI